MKTEEFLKALEAVDTERLKTVEIHADDCYVGIRVDKREFPQSDWFYHFDHYGADEIFCFGGPNSFFNDPVRVGSSEVKEVYADFDEQNPHRGIIVRIYLKLERERNR